MVRSIAAFLLCGLLAAFASAHAEVQVSIDRNPVQVNESFQLVFSLDHSPEREPDFSALQEHFLVLDTGRSNSISIINGEYERSVKWTLQLMAKQAGEFLVPAIRFDKERSKPFQVTVKPAALGLLPHDELFLELLPDRQQTYVQGQVLLRLRLLSATDLAAYQFGNINLDGIDAVLEPLGDTGRYQTRIADRNYLVLEKRFALFPQQAGRIEIPPVLAEVRLPSRQRYDPFQTSGEIRRVRTQKVALDVEPIPESFDAPVWLPAKSLKLVEDWPGDLTRVVAGEPITRSLTLVAEGLTAAQLPEFEPPQIDGIKQYPDQPALHDKRGAKGIVGTRAQKVALIPAAEGRYLIPEIRIPWWNTARGEIETAILPARVLEVAPAVAPAAAVPAPPPAAATDSPPPAAVESNPFWLWLSLLLALGWAATALLWWLGSRRPARPEIVQSPSLRGARRQLQRACAANDAAAARDALLHWGRALLAPRPVAQLQQLARLLGGGLDEEIDALNRSLYAAAPPAWRGETLWRLCCELERQALAPAPPRGGALPPLNPAA